ncbi:pentatricopeptide repeat-containing protein At4g02750 [Selaginella moellendorffii]|nr:pentatricopeptide repeat-containing protein At4g02750 [Selaginella moellendorffii]|eukprot:XP_024533124.1 pentatricopeptide repeat-containing protein At4g02750 [Selaginella moellendorffii]
MPEFNVVSMLTAYVSFGHLEESKSLFDRSETSTRLPGTQSKCARKFDLQGKSFLDLRVLGPGENAAFGMGGEDLSWASRIRSCHTLLAARDLHSRILRPSRYVSNLLIEMYGRLGEPGIAHAAFLTIPPAAKNIFSWALMLWAYARNHRPDQAREIFDQMPLHNLVAHNAILCAAAQSGHLQSAKEIFDAMPEWDLVSHITLLRSYAEGENLDEAMRALERMEERTLIAATAMLSAYARHGHLHQAKAVFDSMPWHDLVSWNAMLTGYAINGELASAEAVFAAMEERDVVSWNSMLSAYAASGHVLKAERVFRDMRVHDVVSGNAMLAAYGLHGQLQKVAAVFQGMLERNLVTWNLMLVAYSQRGQIEMAQCTFDSMQRWNVVSWNALLAAYAKNSGDDLQWRRVFDSMPQRNLVSVNVLLCGLISAGQLGEARMVFDAMEERDLVSWNSMLSAMAAQGDARGAKELFDEMHERNLSSWTALISAQSHTRALDSFRELQLEETPDAVVFLVMLNRACSHSGGISTGLGLLRSMSADFGLDPSKRHYSCVIDLLARGGFLGCARDLLGSMPFAADAVDWRCFLAGSGDGFAKRTAVLGMDSWSAASYVLLANAYS